nr:methylated-DNA--[protein]-cysteine S-methyltransferase [uncultured Pedobacter sp.]
MNKESGFNYQIVAKAIGYLVDNFKQQPSLEQIASHVNLSPFHFQKIFTDWVGVSPKKFAQYLNVNYAKQLLHKNETINLFDTALETGLSGTGRLHDLFVKIEGMTPGEYKNGGQALRINYSFAPSYFGDVLMASTPKGICYLAFFEDSKLALELLKAAFPKAGFKEISDDLQQSVIQVLQHDFTAPQSIKLHLKGTHFQLKVWEALLNIPFGDVSTYGAIAQEVGSPNGARAVGTAIGSNPVALIIPCHRVIQNTGKLGGYMWGLPKKTVILGWEAARLNEEK